MRFTLFAQAQGVRSALPDPLWATKSSADVVTDASLSARKRGVQPGMSIGTAKALVPELVTADEMDGLPSALDKILQIVLQFTPWIEVIEKDAFFFQLPGKLPPLKEIRQILTLVNQEMTTEMRLQIGLAETPQWARALVEWHQVERVPGALYWRVGEQLWLVAPSVAKQVSGTARQPTSARQLVSARQSGEGGEWRAKQLQAHQAGTQGGREVAVQDDEWSQSWMSEMPIPAVWDAPQAVRERLLALGVYRVSELAKVPTSYLKRQFGQESLAWLQMCHMRTHLKVNYPLRKMVREWVSPIGEEIPAEFLTHIVSDLADDLAAELGKSQLGGLKIGVAWKAHGAHPLNSSERTMKQPVFQAWQLLAAVQQLCAECRAEELSLVQLYVEDIQPLTSVQLALTEQRPEERRGTVDILRIVRHVNRKFPEALQIGLHPSFRELRLQAALTGVGVSTDVVRNSR